MRSIVVLKRTLYAANDNDNAIDIYPAGVVNPRKIGSITQGASGPSGLFVDDAGTLYVANAASRTITEYLAGQSSPSTTLAIPDQPVTLTVGPDGTVYVVTVHRNGAYRLVEFDPGVTSPSRSLTFFHGLPCPIYVAGLAADASNDLYLVEVGACGAGGGSIVEYAPRSLKGTYVPLNISDPNWGSWGSALAVIAGEKLLVSSPEYSGSGYLYTFQLPTGTLLNTISLPSKVGIGTYLAFDAGSGYLYLPSTTTSSISIVDSASGTVVGSIPHHGRGVAVYPPSLPW
ncbi:MAG: hypothetical protein ABI282_00280 [Candidatus Baltobacteraceae bacterium]